MPVADCMGRAEASQWNGLLGEQSIPSQKRQLGSQALDNWAPRALNLGRVRTILQADS